MLAQLAFQLPLSQALYLRNQSLAPLCDALDVFEDGPVVDL